MGFEHWNSPREEAKRVIFQVKYVDVASSHKIPTNYFIIILIYDKFLKYFFNYNIGDCIVKY